MPIERIQFIKFKKGCFKDKFPLYENEDLLIGIIIEPKMPLIFQIFFINKSDFEITNLSYKYI